MNVSSSQYAPLLPLSVTGIPSRVTEWLRAAGVPFVEFSSGAVSEGREVQAGTVPPLLFDSRTPSSRSNAEQAVRRGMTILDVAELSRRDGSDASHDSQIVLFDDASPLSPGDARRRLFLERLKNQIEQISGVWIRLADYPYPFQSVLCEDVDWALSENPFYQLAEFITLMSEHEVTDGKQVDRERFSMKSNGIHQFEESCLRMYAAGRPMAWAKNAGLETVQAVSRYLQTGKFPLLWRTTTQEFMSWWTIRRRIQIQIQRDGSRYRIECSMPSDTYQPVLEIWRGGHCAAIPMTNGDMEIDISNVVFQQGGNRHPAGFSALDTQSFFLNEILLAKAG
ncbi:MAG: hypothetical protein Tsb009_31090 [Planctomycetaceae bacterium]